MEVLRELESSPVCQSLAMHSFLMLPMQRITRLPLLLDAIFNRLNSDSQEYLPCKEALHTLNKVSNLNSGHKIISPDKKHTSEPFKKTGDSNA